MTPKTSNELREAFLHFFESKGHCRVRSSPLIPHHDPSLLFANAGMNQFKDYFTGLSTPDHKTATSCQKCVRAGGKHNDLESVGRTKRHHTFFEMLGNFSFGDYFKKEAIEYAWDFLTETLGLSKEDLWISVFREDDEAYDIWTKHMGVPKQRVVRMDEEENFWAMGDTGPCGPCSEIYMDRGEAYGKEESIFDGGERFLEIWNLVFMQFERMSNGEMKPLPKPSVDTGMGLERLASVVQNVDSNYDIDSMQKILQTYAKILSVEYNKNAQTDTALKVLTDHIRASSFLIADGVQPSNEGRGYVLRRIIRRAVRFGKSLGQKKAFFYKGVQTLVDEMGGAYPELLQNKAAIEKMLKMEEEKFLETLDSGLKLLESELKTLSKGDSFPGEAAFKLYDTYGFPLDLTELLLEERGFSLDKQGFDQSLEEQRERSRQSWTGDSDKTSQEIYYQLSDQLQDFEFVGYEALEVQSKIKALIVNGRFVEEISEADKAEIVLEKTAFYAESGGQIGDRGEISSESGAFHVLDTQSPIGKFHIHYGSVSVGNLKKGQSVTAVVNRKQRMRTRIHHTMTHVLHATLQEVLGEHIKQAGSLVGPDYLRFDFSHFESVKPEEWRKIERICNKRILENPSLKISNENIEEALASGAKAFFEDKYGDEVRVLRIGKFSTELCGGTHAESLSEAGIFKIVSESSVASGVRRIVAVTGEAAFEHIEEEEKLLDRVSRKLKSPKKEIEQRIEKLFKERQELLRKLNQKGSSKTVKAKELVEEIENIPSLIQIVEVESPKELRPMADDYKNQIGKGVVILGAKQDNKVSLVISVSKDIADLFDTATLVKKLGDLVDGKGGGRPDFAQLGGSNLEALNRDRIREILSSHIQNLSLSA